MNNINMLYFILIVFWCKNFIKYIRTHKKEYCIIGIAELCVALVLRGVVR